MGYVTDFPILGRGRGGAHGSTSRHVQMVGGGGGAHINRTYLQEVAPGFTADIDLDRESFGLNYPRTCSGTPHITFYFLKARRAVMGPAKRGPIWAG